MSAYQYESSNSSTSQLNLETDVLVIGGGLSATWAAWNAAAQGAKVVLVDKGYCGTSGATAPSGTGVWYVPPDPEQREAAMASREALGGFLSERPWMERVLDQTYTNLNKLSDWGYPFPVDDQGHPHRRSLQQAHDYMRLMRKKITRAGVKILDHSPALELLVDTEGVVAGAKGICRQTGESPAGTLRERWTVRAGAVVIATGGCAFLSKALGCNVFTGDGYLMAAEAGAEMSGMEFSNAYALSPAFSSVTKGAYYRWATFYYGDGTEIEGAGSQKGRSIIARTLLTQPVYACLDKATPEIQAMLRTVQHNFLLPFDRMGIDQEITKLSGLRLRQSRQRIGMIFQHFNLLSCRTVAENIAFPLEVIGYSKLKQRAKVEELISLVGLTGKANTYPAQLSGGQKQRVGIARALAGEPKVLLSDEATSALDPQTTRSILELLRDLNKRMGLTILLITHEMAVVKQICDSVAVLNAGKVVEQGRVSNLITKPESLLAQEVFPRRNGHIGRPGVVLATIAFAGEQASQPIFATLARRFDVDINILSGSVKTVGDRRVGQFHIELEGAKVTQALKYLHESEFEVEVH